MQHAQSTRKPLEELLHDVDKSLPLILLNHTLSKLDESRRQGIDLQLSGHTHAGQLFPSTVITRRIFEDYWGYLRKGGLQVIVTSGVGTWGPPIRIGSRSEIVDAHIEFGGKQK